MVDEADAGARPGSRLEPAAWLALALLSATWAWWAAEEGAYFGVVLLPGAMLLCAGAALLFWFSPRREGHGLSWPVLVSIAALVALAGWSALSALWSPAGDVALLDAQRILTYALCFAVGFKFCTLLDTRLHLALVPLAFAGAFAGAIAVGALIMGDVPRNLLDDGTLEYPLGYRNAEAAFFGVAVFPAVGLASSTAFDWRLRGLALATATLCLDLFLLAQSRASAPALLVGLVAYCIFSPLRVRALSWLALAVLPALGILPAMESLFDAAGDGASVVVEEMNRAGLTSLITVAAALVLGLAAARFERYLPGLGSRSAKSNRLVAYGLVALTIAAVGGFLAAVGDPVDWIETRSEEFQNTSSPDFSESSSRFTFNAGSERYDQWRVAFDDFKDEPLIGDGGGGFNYSYTRKREYAELYVHDAHSIEMELLSELGIVGLVLFMIAIAAAIVGVVRSRTSRAAAHLGAIALASGGYWLTHTSVDWFWAYPAVTAPVLALAGSACAPAVGAIRSGGSSRAARGLLVIGLAGFALSMVPFWLSERYVNSAYAGWRTNLGRAYDDLDRARSLSPLSDTPLLAEASIARASGDRAQAIAALNEAVDLRPEEWAGHYLLAELQARSDPAAARAEARTTLELNPRSPRVRTLARRLGVRPPPLPSENR